MYRAGFIEEVVEDNLSVDIDEQLSSILQKFPEEVETEQKEIIKGFPNALTYSKSLAEKLIKRHRRNLPVVIVRPSIIGPAAVEPHPGWLDGVTIGTEVFIAGGLGVLKDFFGPSESIVDQIPVDYVADLVIAASAVSINKDSLMVYNCSSGCRNPIT